MTASAQQIYKNSTYQWRGDEFIQGNFHARANSATDIISNYKDEWNTSAPNYMPNTDPHIDREHWQLRRNISHLPQYSSTLTMDNALFNMSLEESELAIEPDSTYRTGVYWGGVWTRDVSYAILHSLAQLCPVVSMKSLLRKINVNNRIVQDTGTGGAWPCSTDRVTWVLAAWEIYKVTGDQVWLDRIFPVIRNTIEDDHIVAFDPQTGLMHGETSWLDWREQEYPRWMKPVDIYQSMAMGTTAVHYRSCRILAEICRLKGLLAWAKKYDSWADAMKQGMNRYLWMDDKGLYGIYLYGRRNMVLHPQQEILGESFAILWDIADKDRQQRISQNMVSEPFGTPDFYPNLKNRFPYHNDAMWPFTQGYWIKAQAKAGNEKGVLHGISSIYRLAAMALTNLENMVIYSGTEKGLPINSPRQLWSVAANISIVPSIYFGMTYELDGIHFSPFIPKELNAERHLSNFKYRKSLLDLYISGYGNTLKSFRIDGRESIIDGKGFMPAHLEGHHTITMVLDSHQPTPVPMVMKDNAYQPQTPQVKVCGNVLSWKATEDTKEYVVIRNGSDTEHLPYDLQKEYKYQCTADGEYSVVAIGANGYRSYMSEPVNIYSDIREYTLQPIYSGQVQGLKLSRNENTLVTVAVEVESDATYAIEWQYANGNGPINTENKCATRILAIDATPIGASVFPQRGTGQWQDIGWSNSVCTRLKRGVHTITLEFTSNVENMNIDINEAILYKLRLTTLK